MNHVFAAQQVERRHRAGLHPHRRQGDAAVADDHGGDALRHLAQHALRPAQHGAVVMRMRVDEAGGERQAVGIDLAVGCHRAEVAHRHDPVAGHADIAAERGASPEPSKIVASRMIRSQRTRHRLVLVMVVREKDTRIGLFRSNRHDHRRPDAAGGPAADHRNDRFCQVRRRRGTTTTPNPAIRHSIRTRSARGRWPRTRTGSRRFPSSPRR